MPNEVDDKLFLKFIFILNKEYIYIYLFHVEQFRNLVLIKLTYFINN
jgi:hypothetical protein